MGFSLSAYAEEKKKQSSSGFSLDDYEKQKTAENILAGKFTSVDEAYDDLHKNVVAISKDIESNNSYFGTGYVNKNESNSYSCVVSSRLESLLAQARNTQKHYTEYAAQYDQQYGAGTATKLIDSSSNMVDYLQGQLNYINEFDKYWNQFDSEEDYNEFLRWTSVKNADDFEEKSQYISKPTGKPAEYGLAGMTGGSFEDLKYEYVNRNEEATNQYLANEAALHSKFYGVSKDYLQQMSDDEIAIYNYVYATEGKVASEEYLKYLESHLTAMQMAKDLEYWAEYAKESPVGSSVFSVLTSPFKVMSYAGQLADYVDDGEINENAGYNLHSRIPTTIRGAVSNMIQDTWAGGVGSFAYNLGMSMGDFVFSTAITGGNPTATIAILGAGAAADTTLAAKERGLSDDQAITLGTLAGIIEAATERIGFDALFGKLGNKLAKTGKAAYFFGNVGAEAAEEGLATSLNWLADALVAQDMSEWNMSINQYMAQGMTRSEAIAQTVLDHAGELALDILGGAISGGTISGGTLGINSMSGAISNYTDAASLGKEYLASNPSYRDFMMETVEVGLQADPNSDFFKTATAINDKFENAKATTITEYEIGQLLLAQKTYTENQTATDSTNAITEQLMTSGANEVTAKKVAPILQSLSSGAEISGGQASLIAQIPAAIDYLKQTYGVQINTDAPLSSLKAEIKNLNNPDYRQKMAENSAGNSVGQSYQSETEGAVIGRNSASGANAVELTPNERLMRYANEVNLGDNGRRTMVEMYDGDSDFVNFAGAFTAYYQAGASGTPISAVKSNLSSAVSDYVKAAAYKSGQMDALLSVPNNGQRSANSVAQPNSTLPNGTISDTIDNNYDDDSDFEVIYDGKQGNESSGGNGERSHRVDSRESGSSVQRRSREKKTGSETQRRRAESIKNNVNAEGVERVTTASQGISIGTNNPTLQVVPRNLYTEEMKAVSKEQFAKGRRVIFFVGQLEMKQNGETFTARGALSKDGKRIWIQADNPSLTVEQIAKHEEFHALIKKDADLLDRTRRQIIAQYGETELQELVDSYIDSYGWTELSDNYILEEILADAYAEIDVFDYLTDYEGATRFSDTVQESAKSVKDTATSIENDTGQEQFSRSKGSKLTPTQKKAYEERKIFERIRQDQMRRYMRENNETLPEEWCSYGEDYFYAYENYSMMDYRVIFKIKITDKNSNRIQKVERRLKGDGREFDLARRADDRFAYGEKSSQYADNRNNVNASEAGGTGRVYEVDDLSSGSNGSTTDKEGGGNLNGGRTSGLTEKFSRDTERYDYDTLVAKDDIELTVIDDSISYPANSQTRKQIVTEALKNAATIGKTNSSGGVSVYVDDIGTDVLVSNNSLRHGLDRRLQENAAVTLKAGEILKNAIRVNELTPKHINASDSYVLIGVAKNMSNKPYVVEFVVNKFTNTVKSIAVLYSVNTKNESAVHNAPSPTKNLLAVTDSKISVSQLLDLSIDNFPDVLSESVLRHYGYESRPDGKIGESALFSRESSLYLQEQNEELQKQVEALKKEAAYWKNQTKRTTQPTLRDSDIKKLTTSLLSDYSSKADKTSVATALKNIGEFIVRGGDQHADLEWSVVKDRAVDIARDIIRSAVELNDGESATYKEIRNYLRTTRLHITPALKSEIEYLSDDYNTFRKRNMGRLWLSLSDGIGVDTAYQELQNKYGTALFPEDITADADQLIHLTELVPTLQNVYENPYSYDMAEAIEFCANDIIQALLSEDVRQTAPTFADRQHDKLVRQRAHSAERLETLREQKNSRIEEVRRQGREYAARAVERERARRAKHVDAIKQHYRDVAQRQRTHKAESKARERLLRIVRRLNNKKLPAVQRGLLNQYIGEIDTVAVSITGKTVEKLQDLYMWYTEQKETNPDFLGDERTEKMLRRLSQRQIKEMTIEEVTELTQVLLNIENEIRTQRKLIDSQERRDIYLAGAQTIDNINNTRPEPQGKLSKFFGDAIVSQTLSPLRLVERMTGYNESDPLYVATQELNEGQHTMQTYRMQRYHEFRKYTENKTLMSRITGKKAQEITVTARSGDKTVKVKITPAMRMSLYLHSLNPQNMRHIQEGGVSVPDMALYKKGNIEEAYNRSTRIQLTRSEIAKLAEGMTPLEKEFAMAVHKYFNQTSSEAINEVSEKLLGYSVATVDNYFRIDVDSSFTKAEFASIKYDGSIEGMGFLKERVNSSNPVMLRDVNDVLLKAIEQHSMYVGMAIPIRNFNKLWSVTTRSYSEDGTRVNVDDSVQSALRRSWGKQGYKYIEKMMTDISNPNRDTGTFSTMFAKLKGTYAASVIALNISPALKQFASYITASSILGTEALAKTAVDFSKVDIELINKYTPLLWLRSQGYSTVELGDIMDNGNAVSKLLSKKALNWNQGVDILVAKRLWVASEYYIKKHSKDLKVGTDEYYKDVARLFNRVIEDTQTNHSLMQRPQISRSSNVFVQGLTMFKTDAFQIFNILYNSYGRAVAKKRAYTTLGTEQAKSEYRQAVKGAVRASTSVLATFAFVAAITLAVATFRDKDDKYENEDGEKTLGSVLGGMSRDMFSNLASIVPLGDIAAEGIDAIIFGDRFYGFDNISVSAFGDMINAIYGTMDMVAAIVEEKKENGNVNWNKVRLEFDNLVSSYAAFFGAPVNNVENFVGHTIRVTAKAVTGSRIKGDYIYLKMTKDAESNSSEYYNLLYRAYKEKDGSYEDIVADMLESKYLTEEKIRGAMDERLKKEQGVASTKDMEYRYLFPDEQERYDDILDDVDDSYLWGRATKSQQKYVKDEIYKLVAQTSTPNSAGSKMQDKIDASGISESDYILYELALKLADSDGNDHNTSEEMTAAIDMLRLRRSDSAALWDVESKNKNPYR